MSALTCQITLEACDVRTMTVEHIIGKRNSDNNNVTTLIVMAMLRPQKVVLCMVVDESVHGFSFSTYCSVFLQLTLVCVSQHWCLLVKIVGVIITTNILANRMTRQLEGNIRHYSEGGSVTVLERYGES